MHFRRSGASGGAQEETAAASPADEAPVETGNHAQASQSAEPPETSQTPPPRQRPRNPPQPRRPARLGLALGGGAARGWAHIGALRVLDKAGFAPDVVVGTSIGAVVGGCFAIGSLDILEEFATSLTRRRVMGLMDFSMGGSGLISGNRLRQLLEQDIGRLRMEDLPNRFATVATELGSGHEVWLTRGPVVDAMRASYALPGIFDPVCIGGRWLMDGALVNPIPVTVARALGAEFVLAINLNGDLRSNRASTIPSHGPLEEDVAGATPQEATEKPGGILGAFGAARRIGRFARRPDGAPGIGTVMMDAFNITQDRISRSRLAGDPPNLMISPRLGQIGLFDFHRATEAMQLGAEAAERCLPELEEMLELADISG
ncbi:patatin-like phospholipase family protein [Camelimonas sp. ID_303_24]